MRSLLIPQPGQTPVSFSEQIAILITFSAQSICSILKCNSGENNNSSSTRQLSYCSRALLVFLLGTLSRKMRKTRNPRLLSRCLTALRLAVLDFLLLHDGHPCSNCTLCDSRGRSMSREVSGPALQRTACRDCFGFLAGVYSIQRLFNVALKPLFPNR